MSAKGISIEMPIGADAPLLADGETLNPFFGYISQSANRAGYKGVELIGGKMWLRKITDVGPRGFNLPLMLQVAGAGQPLFGEATEVHNYPTVLKVSLANKDDELPAYVEGVADVLETPAVPAVVDEETGEEITPAVDAVYRPARYSDLQSRESDGFLYCINGNGRNYQKGSVCLQLAAEPGVEVVAISDFPQAPEVE